MARTKQWIEEQMIKAGFCPEEFFLKTAGPESDSAGNEITSIETVDGWATIDPLGNVTIDSNLDQDKKKPESEDCQRQMIMTMVD